MSLELDPLDEHSELWRAGYEEGVRRTLKIIPSQYGIPTGADDGYDISSVKLLKGAIQDLPNATEVLDAFAMPLRGEISDNFSYGKALYVYGRRLRPYCLGEPF